MVAIACLAVAQTGPPLPPPAAPAVPAGPAGPVIIPLPDLAMRSQQLTQSLRDLTATLPPQDQIASLTEALKAQQILGADKVTEVEALLAGAPSAVELREQETFWRGLIAQNLTWRKQLLEWANQAQAAVKELGIQEPQWTATLQATVDLPDQGTVVELVRANINEIRRVRTLASTVLQQVVAMQIDNGSQEQVESDILDKLVRSRLAFQENLFHRDSLPIWQFAKRRQLGEVPPLFKFASGRWSTVRSFIRENVGALLFLLVFLFLCLWFTYNLRQIARLSVLAGKPPTTLGKILRNWISIAFLPVLPLSYLVIPSAPNAIVGFVILLSFLPVLRLLPPLLERRLRLLLYVMSGGYAVSLAIGWLSPSYAVARELQFVASVTIQFVFIRALGLFQRTARKDRLRLGTLILRGTFIVLTVALVANSFGYVKLAQFIGVVSTFSAFIAIYLVTGFLVFSKLTEAAVDDPRSSKLAIVRLHRDQVVRWIPRILKWGGALLWVTATLDLLGARAATFEKIGSFLNFSIGGADSNITVGGIVGFFLILLVGYFVASAIRFVLREEILGRFQLERGVPELVSASVHYLLLLLVFFGAINAAGVQLNKLTVLTGAFGVGIGFGLQNIINNFVSGLILQFERPIHLNDVLEVEGLTGTVTRIGVRSSTLLTAQGAEIIFPNATLISGKVTNWTLTESKRRGELVVGVAYGTDSSVVIRLLLEAANRHESVLVSPAPAAYFTGFGDSSLNFELHFWVLQTNNWMKVKSEIAMVVMRSFDSAGIEIPFPQRELHLRSTGLPEDKHTTSGAA